MHGQTHITFEGQHFTFR